MYVLKIASRSEGLYGVNKVDGFSQSGYRRREAKALTRDFHGGKDQTLIGLYRSGFLNSVLVPFRSGILIAASFRSGTLIAASFRSPFRSMPEQERTSFSVPFSVLKKQKLATYFYFF